MNLLGFSLYSLLLLWPMVLHFQAVGVNCFDDHVVAALDIEEEEEHFITQPPDGPQRSEMLDRDDYATRYKAPCFCMPGPAGPAGIPGIPGNHGSIGPRGALGHKGAMGRKGMRGAKGQRGMKGVKGKRGSKGDMGVPAPDPVRVAFSVQRNQTFGKFSYDFDIRFDHTLTNQGGAYNEHTSHVTIPFDCTFLFMFSSTGNSGNTLVNLVVNGLRVASAWGHYTPNIPYPSASNHAILRLKYNDRVWLRLAAGSTMNYGTVPSVLTFSGYMLWRDDV